MFINLEGYRGIIVTDPKKKTIELWDGYEVELDTTLMDDFDFVSELSEATAKGNVPVITEMYLALVGGPKTYDDLREYLIAKEGRVTVEGVGNVLEKIYGVLPKAGNRAQRRSWRNSA